MQHQEQQQQQQQQRPAGGTNVGAAPFRPGAPDAPPQQHQHSAGGRAMFGTSASGDSNPMHAPTYRPRGGGQAPVGDSNPMQAPTYRPRGGGPPPQAVAVATAAAAPMPVVQQAAAVPMATAMTMPAPASAGAGGAPAVMTAVPVSTAAPVAHHHHHHHHHHQHQHQQHQHGIAALPGAGAPPASAPSHHHHHHHHSVPAGSPSGLNLNATPYVREDRGEDELFKDHTAGIDFSKYESIEVTVNPADIPAANSFQEMSLHPMLTQNIARCQYTNPTPVQKASVPIVMNGKDLMACAQTGSGKTAAFLLPTVNFVLLNCGRAQPDRVGQPSALILSPTRELGCQIYDEARKFTYYTGLRSVIVYGGTDVRHQIQELQRGCNLLIATPGRLDDFFGRGIVSYRKVQFLVLDEADKQLDMGFMPQLQKIVNQCDMPAAGERQTLMYSATFAKEVQTLARSFLSPHFYFLQVGRVGSTTENITQSLIWVEDHEKVNRLVQVLQQFENQLVLVFVEKKRDCDYIERQLYNWNFAVCAIHGDRQQRDREMALSMFKAGQRKVLIATDVAARGLDIPSVALVLQYDLPTNIDDYVHRIGRTGRAGNRGNAWGFFNEKNRNISDDLYDLLDESRQEKPDFIPEPRRRQHHHHVHGAPHHHRGGGGRGGHRGGHRGGGRGGHGGFYDSQGNPQHFGGHSSGHGSSGFHHGHHAHHGAPGAAHQPHHHHHHQGGGGHGNHGHGGGGHHHGVPHGRGGRGGHGAAAHE